MLLQRVVIGRDPADAAAEIAAGADGQLTVEQLLDTPFVLLAQDVGQAVAELRRRQRVYGFDSVTTHQPHLEALGEVIAAHRAADAQSRAEGPHGCLCTSSGVHIRSYGSLCTFLGRIRAGISVASG